MSDIFTIIPWLCLLLVFSGMAALQWRALSGLYQLAKTLAELLGNTAPKSIVVPGAPTVSTAPPRQTVPTPLPAPPQPKVSEAQVVPTWFVEAQKEIGFHEVGNNLGIEKYIELAKCGAVGEPWCAIFVNAMLEKVGVPGTRSPSSQSFLNHPAFVKLDKPVKGCIVVFWRTSPSSGLGHVGFYDGEDATHITTLGGNEGDMVADVPLPKSSSNFGFEAYMWPKGVPLAQGVSAQAPVASTAPAASAAPPATDFRALVAGGYFSSSPFDKSIPASIRTNNPGALNVAPWIKSAPGYVGDKVTSMSGAEANSTVIFSAPEYGVAAWLTLLQKYRAAGATTVSAIITRYGGGQDYSSYVTEVAAWSGLTEQTEIKLDGSDDPGLLAFAKAMFRYEAGRPTPLSDAQILYGFNLARGASIALASTVSAPAAPPATPNVT